jgi:hypothetical protein
VTITSGNGGSGDITSSNGETYYATNRDAIQTVVLEQSGGPGADGTAEAVRLVVE